MRLTRRRATFPIFTTAAPCTSSAPSLPTRRWYWRTSNATTNPTKSRCARPDHHSGHRRRDALPKEAFEQAAASGVHLIAQLKNNQPALHHTVAALCDTEAPLDRACSADKKRGCRDETRLIEVFMLGDGLAGTEWAGHVRAVIRVTRDVLIRSAVTGLWRATGETAFFVRDIVLAADVCATVIRCTPASSPACARSPPTFCASLRFATSPMLAIASPSEASTRSWACGSC